MWFVIYEKAEKSKKEAAELQMELERQHSENAVSEERKKHVELELEKLHVEKLRLQVELARMGAGGRSWHMFVNVICWNRSHMLRRDY